MSDGRMQSEISTSSEELGRSSFVRSVAEYASYNGWSCVDDVSETIARISTVACVGLITLVTRPNTTSPMFGQTEVEFAAYDSGEVFCFCSGLIDIIHLSVVSSDVSCFACNNPRREE